MYLSVLPQIIQKGEKNKEILIVYKIDQTIGFQIWLDLELSVKKRNGGTWVHTLASCPWGLL